MYNALRNAAVAVAVVGLASAAQADVLTFDNLLGAPVGPFGAQRFFVVDYQGFTFGTNNANDTAWFYTNAPSPDYIPHSGFAYVASDYRLYLPNPGLLDPTQAISNTQDFRFDGAWFSGSEPVQYKLYNHGALVYTSNLSPVLTPTSQWVPSGHTGPIDQVVILGRQGYYIMDDFTYAPSPSPVPEPAAFGLMVAGLVGVGAVVRRARPRPNGGGAVEARASRV